MRTIVDSSDPADEALQHVARAAEDAAEEQRDIARRARALSRARRRGATSVELVEAGAVSVIIAGIRANARRLSAAARHLQAAIVTALSRDGLTTREIGRLIGVSHQHVSALSSRRAIRASSSER